MTFTFYDSGGTECGSVPTVNTSSPVYVANLESGDTPPVPDNTAASVSLQGIAETTCLTVYASAEGSTAGYSSCQILALQDIGGPLTISSFESSLTTDQVSVVFSPGSHTPAELNGHVSLIVVSYAGLADVPGPPQDIEVSDFLYERALSGNLTSEPKGSQDPFVFVNDLGLPLRVYYVSNTGLQCGYDAESASWTEGAPGLELPPNGLPVTIDSVYDHSHFVVRLDSSGGFVAVVTKDGAQAVPAFINAGYLLEPGIVGPIPKPALDRLIPPDSARVVVGVGTLPNGNTVVREQYWRLSPDSYSLAPGEKVTDSVTLIAGMESNSSDQDEVSSAVSGSAGLSYGPASMSISASLSETSTTFQQVTVNRQTTNFKSIERGPSDEPVTWFLWQLAEVITIFDTSGPAATIVSLTQPPIIRKGNPAPSPHDGPARRRMTAEERKTAPGSVSSAARG